jgi:hypothetical protein
LTLLRYQDAASRRLVVDFIRVALAKNPEVAARTIHTGLLEVSHHYSITTKFISFDCLVQNINGPVYF